jgi:ACR3 family arsenite efflux pump ArsB
MKKNKTLPELKKHLKHFIMLSLLLSLTILIFSSLFIIFDDPSGIFTLSVPLIVYYAGMFVSVMMMVIGVYYLRALKSLKLK